MADYPPAMASTAKQHGNVPETRKDGKGVTLALNQRGNRWVSSSINIQVANQTILNTQFN